MPRLMCPGNFRNNNSQSGWSCLWRAALFELDNSSVWLINRSVGLTVDCWLWRFVSLCSLVAPLECQQQPGQPAVAIFSELCTNSTWSSWNSWSVTTYRLYVNACFEFFSTRYSHSKWKIISTLLIASCNFFTFIIYTVHTFPSILKRKMTSNSRSI